MFPFCSLIVLFLITMNRLEHGVYNLSRLRESASKKYKVYNIPTDWMLDAGFVSQVIWFL